MDSNTADRRDYRFLIGLMAGTCLGGALAMWLGPDIRERYSQTRSRVDELTRKGQDVRNDVAGAVARGAHEVERNAREVAQGAHEVERYATAAMSR